MAQPNLDNTYLYSDLGSPGGPILKEFANELFLKMLTVVARNDHIIKEALKSSDNNELEVDEIHSLMLSKVDYIKNKYTSLLWKVY